MAPRIEEDEDSPHGTGVPQIIEEEESSSSNEAGSQSDEVVITIQITGSNIEDSGVQELDRSRPTKQTQSEAAFSSQRLQHLIPAVMRRSMS